MLNVAVVITVLLIITKNALSDSDFVMFSTTESPSLPHSDVSRLSAKIETLEKEFGNLRNDVNAIQQLIYQNVKKITVPKNCKELQYQGQSSSGIYTVQPKTATKSFPVFCDMTTKGGGWTYFLNRFDGFEEFHRGWDDYKNGFGSLAGEHWLGLEQLHFLTDDQPNELLIELVDWESNKVFAKYSNFSIGSESHGYNIKLLGRYSGNAGDSLSRSAGMKFSTYDKDQDLAIKTHCASFYESAWWHKDCSLSELTAKYVLGEICTALKKPK